MEASDYTAAVKKVQASKAKENYLLFTVSWDINLILPYKEGMLFMEALGKAEKLEEPYDKPPGIRPLDRDRIGMKVLSAKEYEQIKIAQLLQVKLRDVQEYETNNT